MIPSRENIKKAITFTGPEKVPVNSEFNPEYSKFSDCLGVSYREMAVNEWGYSFERLENDKTMGQVLRHPLDSWRAYSSWNVPSLCKTSRFEGVKERVADLKDRGYFVWGLMGSFIFERLHYLRGMNNLFEDLYLEEEKLLDLGNQIRDFQIEIVKAYAHAGVDGIWGGDDWGMQKQLLISPDKWRQFFKPWYSAIFGTAHQLGLLSYMHSCGYNREIMDDLVDTGLDVIELHQPTLMGIDWLSENYGGKLCFSCSVDIQRTLPKGNITEIENQIVKLKEKLGKFNGGLIYNVYPDHHAIGVSGEIMDNYLSLLKKHCSY